jgi:type IV pilus assembly protein PilV
MKAARLYANGFTLLEVLITIVILAFGLLGLTHLQTKLHMTEMESYQRAQAVVLLQDYANRMQAAGFQNVHDHYVTGTADPLGNGDDFDDDTEAADCEADYTDIWDQDACHWSVLLKGAAEVDAGGNKTGAMIGARGCVEEIQAANETPGLCAPAIYRISLAWQGLFQTAAPGLACGQNQYGNEALRRVISTTVTIGVPGCTSI